MSGHSKWSNIKRAKGIQDAKRGNLFTRLSKDVSIAAKLGGGDVNSNPMLKIAINKAKSANMPNDKIQKAIGRGMGLITQGDIQYEKIYEVYAPYQIPALIEVLTDNPNRTLTEIKIALTKNGGKLVNEGSISWQFKEIGIIKALCSFDKPNEANKSKDEVELSLYEIEGIENIQFIENMEESIFEIIVETKKENLKRVYDAITVEVPEVNIETANLAKIYTDPGMEDNVDERGVLEVMEWIANLQDIAEVENVWIGLNLTK
jgi:YebC/PmpR family DNA-binding regulatory protein